MKNRTKRIVCLALVLLLVCAVALPVAAAMQRGQMKMPRPVGFTLSGGNWWIIVVGVVVIAAAVVVAVVIARKRRRK